MAKVTVTFEDIEDGVSVKVVSDPAFPGPDATPEEQDALTDAQHMGMRMTELLTEQADSEHHCHDEHCTHDHHAAEN